MRNIIFSSILIAQVFVDGQGNRVPKPLEVQGSGGVSGYSSRKDLYRLRNDY